MKKFIALVVLLLLFTPGVSLARKLILDPDAPNIESLVTAISVVKESQGTITISDDDAPFVVTAGTTIIIDGHPATISDVKKGMQVMSRTLSDSSAPEIDLKTVQS